MYKSFMWQNEATGGTSGAQIDLDDGIIQWFEAPGCACGGSDGEQTIADFLENGPRALIPPDDVIEEMRQAIKTVPKA
ncbi:MAG: hypothetical protein Phog2KO_44790 [Phototrophicaceae bacterium]